MKKFNIVEVVNYIDNKTPFKSDNIRGLNYSPFSYCKVIITFHDGKKYHFNLDDETYYKV